MECTKCGQQHQRCTAHNRAGNPCGKHPRPGMTVCEMHGGKAPQAEAAAKRRILEAIDPAAGELARIALHGKRESDRLAAIRELFNRHGFGETPRTEVVHISEDVLDAEIRRLEEELAFHDDNAG